MRAGMLAVIAAVLWAGAARADNDKPQPWAVGVSAEQKATARGLLDTGNDLFLARKYNEALTAYRNAIKAWDHPAIRFNIVRCLILLDKPVDAAGELERALAYGDAPFEDTLYSEALGYQKLLASSTAEVEVSCTQPGVMLTLDGQALPGCPTKQTHRLLPGKHQIVGKKPGFLADTVEVVVLGGKRERAEVSLVPLSEGARVEHRWAQWVPWTVFGSGFAVAGIGTLLRLSATRNNDAFGELVSRDCADGCPGGQADRSLESRAKLENTLAISCFALGAATIVTGSVMIYLNRGRTVLAPAAEHRPASGASVGVVPLRGGAAIGISGAF